MINNNFGHSSQYCKVLKKLCTNKENSAAQENVPWFGDIQKFQRLDKDLSVTFGWIESLNGRPD